MFFSDVSRIFRTLLKEARATDVSAGGLLGVPESPGVVPTRRK